MCECDNLHTRDQYRLICHSHFNNVYCNTISFHYCTQSMSSIFPSPYIFFHHITMDPTLAYHNTQTIAKENLHNLFKLTTRICIAIYSYMLYISYMDLHLPKIFSIIHSISNMLPVHSTLVHVLPTPKIYNIIGYFAH